MAKFQYSYEAQKISPFLKKMDDLFFGNYSLDDQKTKYLRKFPAETDAHYKRRVATSVYFNFLSPIIKGIAEKPFNNKITYSEQFPEQLEYLKDNIDLSNETILMFAFSCMIYGLRHGFVGLLPDQSNAGAGFIRLIPAPDILGVWKNSTGKFQRVLFQTNSIYTEDEANADSASFKEYNETKIFELIASEGQDVRVREYAVQSQDIDSYLAQLNKIMNASLFFTAEVIEERILKGIKEIPFYLFKTAPPSKKSHIIDIAPPFFDLASMNISHFNKQSDQDNILTVSRYAILFATGVSNDDIERNFSPKSEIRGIGPNTILTSQNKDARFGFVEHSGKAIEAGTKDLLNLEKKMMSVMLDYLTKEVIETATENIIDEKNRTLYTVSLANQLEDIISQCIFHIAGYEGITLNEEDRKNLISFSKDYNALETKTKIQALIKAREMGDITLLTFLSELSSMNTFSNTFNADDEATKVMEQASLEPQNPPAADPNDEE